ncbi:MAG: FAD-dependent thymidylate synthase [Elusimicrobia bacterium]|nr:FAD-dependent thymidylate synthase [Elusimicrobiota bacterium]
MFNLDLERGVELARTRMGISPEPVVHLINAFDLPYDNAVATARTCYSPKVIYAEDVNKDEAERDRRDRIARSTFLAGHHTTLQHASFQFVLERVSRQCIWSFLHSHPFYNSEQVSQRYVAVSPENFAVPPLEGKALELYKQSIQSLMETYIKLQELLRPTAEQEYAKLFPHRNIQEKRWGGALRKKCQEIARYVLPVATHAHLYHTISGLTLLRYLRLCQSLDTPLEEKIVVTKMVEEVQKIDPEFLKNAEDPIPLEETPEYIQFTAHRPNFSHSSAAPFLQEFDDSISPYTSKLVDYKIHSEKVMADSVRHLLGLRESEMDDLSAIELVMRPGKNPYLSETLNVNHHAKLTRAMVHPHFTFRKKISHTADSQDQRHRTVPGSRPVLASHFSSRPDYVTPLLIQKNPSALQLYQDTMQSHWNSILQILDLGVKSEYALYLLPNAVPIRFEESGSLIDLHHKWVHRLCYTAQEEIWKSCLEEVQQVRQIFPAIGQYLAAPCSLRKTADRKPYCPEGDRFCGVRVWELPLESYERIL